MKGALALGGVLMLLGGAGTARAQEDDEVDYHKLGMVVELGFALGLDTFDKDGLDNDGLQTGLGVNGRFGFRVHPMLAVEAHIEQLWNFSGDRFDDTCVYPCERYPKSMTAVMLDGRFYPTGIGYDHLDWRLQPWVSYGVGALLTHDPSGADPSGFAMRFGAGVDFYLTQSLALVGEASYVLPPEPSPVSRYSYFSLGAGLQYRFD